MKLSKIQKNLNIQILEKGRQTFRNYYYPVVIYFFLSPFIVMPIFDVQSADAQFSLAFVMTIWTGPPIIVVILLSLEDEIPTILGLFFDTSKRSECSKTLVSLAKNFLLSKLKIPLLK